MKHCTFEQGTLLYHGTGSEEFSEAEQQLDTYSWLSTSLTVATKFANRWSDGIPRVAVYRLTQDVRLPQIDSQREMQNFADEHNLSLYGVEEIRDSVRAAQLPGWVIPFNYPDGDDILLADTHLLEYVETLKTKK